METDTMGRVVVNARIENLGDLWRARDGELQRDEVRAVEVEDAQVDSGTTMLSLPKRIIKKLGLRKSSSRRMRTAKGSVLVKIYDAVNLTIQGHDCRIDVAVVPDDCPVLIGQVPLELLDFVVDPKRQKLIGNPEHGGKFMHDMF